jgi:hypothetical protein
MVTGEWRIEFTELVFHQQEMSPEP